MARLENDQGGAVYFNPILKHGKEAWVIKGIGDTVILGRDRQRKKHFYAVRPSRSLPPAARLQPGDILRQNTRGRQLDPQRGQPPPSFSTPITTLPSAVPPLFFPKEKTGPSRGWVVCLPYPGTKARQGASVGRIEGKMKAPPMP